MRRAALVVLIAAAALPASAHATFPGANGKVAFTRAGDIWTMNPDGSDQVNLTSTPGTERDPRWSPDGTKIAFVDPGFDLYVMNADGTGKVPVTLDVTSGVSQLTWSADGTQFALVGEPTNHDPSILRTNADGSGTVVIDENNRGYYELDWAPDGSRIAFIPLNFGGLTGDIVLRNPDGSNRTVLVGEDDPEGEIDEYTVSWSPNASRVAYTVDASRCGNCGTSGQWTVKRDGTDRQLVATDGGGAVYSPDGTKIAYVTIAGITVMNVDGTGPTTIGTGSDLDWQPIPINAYPRPKGASPMQVSLVPAYQPCTAPNSTHGAPLAFSSCTPPQPASAHLTTGTPDANGRPVRMNASLTFKVVTGDVHIQTNLNDVANTDLTDYTGSLRAQVPVRITDKLNTPHPGGPGAATTQPFVYGFTVPCTSDPGPAGSGCSLATTMNALAPGTHADGRRAVWQLGKVQVFDGGSDADGSTTADNTLFAVQGVFVP